MTLSEPENSMFLVETSVQTGFSCAWIIDNFSKVSMCQTYGKYTVIHATYSSHSNNNNYHTVT